MENQSRVFHFPTRHPRRRRVTLSSNPTPKTKERKSAARRPPHSSIRSPFRRAENAISCSSFDWEMLFCTSIWVTRATCNSPNRRFFSNPTVRTSFPDNAHRYSPMPADEWFRHRESRPSRRSPKRAGLRCTCDRRQLEKQNDVV